MNQLETQLSSMRQEHEVLKEQNINLKTDNQELRKENQDLIERLASYRSELETIQNSHQGNLDQLDERFEQIMRELEKYKSQNMVLSE